MSLFLFLSVLQAIIAAALVGIVLMQRSEGGGLGLGGGGSPGGLMSARGAADFLTRTTKWLAVLFVALAIALAALAVRTAGGEDLDDSLQRTAPSAAPDPLAPANADPLAAPAAVPPAAGAPPPAAAPAPDPLAGAAE
jgi:preprotein translocase subunit SecG